MSEQAAMNGAPDYALYVKNRSSHSPDELAPYGDQWVIWSPDGLRVLAHDADLDRLAETVKAAGLNREEVHLEWIPPGGEVETLL